MISENALSQLEASLEALVGKTSDPIVLMRVRRANRAFPIGRRNTFRTNLETVVMSLSQNYYFGPPFPPSDNGLGNVTYTAVGNFDKVSEDRLYLMIFKSRKPEEDVKDELKRRFRLENRHIDEVIKDRNNRYIVFISPRDGKDTNLPRAEWLAELGRLWNKPTIMLDPKGSDEKGVTTQTYIDIGKRLLNAKLQGLAKGSLYYARANDFLDQWEGIMEREIADSRISGKVIEELRQAVDSGILVPSDQSLIDLQDSFSSLSMVGMLGSQESQPPNTVVPRGFFDDAASAAAAQVVVDAEEPTADPSKEPLKPNKPSKENLEDVWAQLVENAEAVVQDYSDRNVLTQASAISVTAAILRQLAPVLEKFPDKSRKLAELQELISSLIDQALALKDGGQDPDDQSQDEGQGQDGTKSGGKDNAVVAKTRAKTLVAVGVVGAVAIYALYRATRR